MSVDLQVVHVLQANMLQNILIEHVLVHKSLQSLNENAASKNVDMDTGDLRAQRMLGEHGRLDAEAVGRAAAWWSARPAGPGYANFIRYIRLNESRTHIRCWR